MSTEKSLTGKKIYFVQLSSQGGGLPDWDELPDQDWDPHLENLPAINEESEVSLFLEQTYSRAFEIVLPPSPGLPTSDFAALFRRLESGEEPGEIWYDLVESEKESPFSTFWKGCQQFLRGPSPELAFLGLALGYGGSHPVTIAARSWLKENPPTSHWLRPRFTPEHPGPCPWRLSESAEGRFLVLETRIITCGPPVKVWDLRAGKPRRLATQPRGPIAFFDDETFVEVYRGSAILHDLDGVSRTCIEHPKLEARMVTVTPAGRLMCTSGDPKVRVYYQDGVPDTLRIWDLKRGQLLAEGAVDSQIHELSLSQVTCSAICPYDSRLLATGDRHGRFQVWELGSEVGPVACLEGSQTEPDPVVELVWLGPKRVRVLNTISSYSVWNISKGYENTLGIVDPLPFLGTRQPVSPSGNWRVDFDSGSVRVTHSESGEELFWPCSIPSVALFRSEQELLVGFRSGQIWALEIVSS